ncbi:polysaccharide deacetylase family protein [Anaerosacchariphilus polymeriproducens]|uniref:Polysaccharide deacetylase n=1 Tax=Anaerosacchariphilus polymeriproducens TaxID=1812858 RepID=A0A371AS35_9FIRM|nr:polysaccharide deacetylase family protein [Anaerosacchariphilus polymeriproducens]RDU22369.1 polysaccharide deacetylase [Anaerosacchariphilus polymeriproducens]
MQEDQMLAFKAQRQRDKRIAQFKRNLLILAVIAIILPTLLCIYLFFKVNSLEDKLAALYKEGTAAVSQKRTDDNTVYASQDLKPDEVNAVENPSLNEQKTLNQETTGVQTPETNDSKKEKKIVYLTFDDGPSSNTKNILKVLKEHNVKATFFVVGNKYNSEEFEAMYKQIVEEGHTIGMHSYSHQYSTIYQSLDAFKEDLNLLQDYLNKTIGMSPAIYRFPGGSSNKVSDTKMEVFINYLKEKNLTYFDWNVSSGDAAGQNLSVEEIVNNTMEGVSKNQTSVVLMHDSEHLDSTVEALGKIIEQLKEQGIEILPIDQKTTPVQQLKAK